MGLLEKIKQDMNEARKAKNTFLSNLLGTLYAEAKMVGKNDGNRESTDAEVVAKIKVFIKNIEETLKAVKPDTEHAASLRDEKSALEKYLPRQLTEAELLKLIEGIAGHHEKSMKSMGKVMAELKEKHGGEYDGALASKVVKEVLSR